MQDFLLFFFICLQKKQIHIIRFSTFRIDYSTMRQHRVSNFTDGVFSHNNNCKMHTPVRSSYLLRTPIRTFIRTLHTCRL